VGDSRHYKRLPLEGLCNARDLGGFATAGGGVTRYGVFVRSELPARLTEGDIRFIREYGLTLSMDLRSLEEIRRRPSLLAGQESWHKYVPRPLFDEYAAAYDGIEPEKAGDFSWLPEYIQMAEKGKLWVRRNFQLAAQWEGGILYHCFTGKDRTGIFTAMLLGLCGVADLDIAWDYSISMICLAPVYQMIAEAGVFADAEGHTDTSRGFFLTSPDTMLGFLRHIRDTYGSMRDYVLSCGVREEEINAVVRRLTEGV